MARVSNISKFLGGASNVQVMEILRGEQRTVTGTCSIVTPGGNADSKTAQDITGWDIEAKTAYTEADVTPTGSSVTLTNFVQSNVSGSVDELDVSITDGPNGQFTYLIPKDLYPEDIEIDATRVPLVVVYVTIANGPKPASGTKDTRTIRQFRHVIIVREGKTLLDS